MILRWAMIFCLAIGPVSYAQSTDAAKQTKLHELFQTIKLDRTSTLMMNQAMNMMQASLSQQLPTTKCSAQQQDINGFLERVKKYVNDTLNWKTMEPQYIKIYADVYTDQEIDGMLAFYQSPAGQAVIEKTPLVLKESMSMAQQNMATMLPVVQQMAKDFVAEKTANCPVEKQMPQNNPIYKN